MSDLPKSENDEMQMKNSVGNPGKPLEFCFILRKSWEPNPTQNQEVKLLTSYSPPAFAGFDTPDSSGGVSHADSHHHRIFRFSVQNSYKPL